MPTRGRLMACTNGDSFMATKLAHLSPDGYATGERHTSRHRLALKRPVDLRGPPRPTLATSSWVFFTTAGSTIGDCSPACCRMSVC